MSDEARTYRHLGYDGVGAGQAEKIICLKNRHDLGIVNGMFLGDWIDRRSPVG
jgi:hypothetical protein